MSEPLRDHPGLSLHAKDQCSAGLEHAARLLHEEFDGVVGSDLVTEVVREVTGRFSDATVLSFVPLLVRRYAREELLTRSAELATARHPSEADLLSRAT